MNSVVPTEIFCFDLCGGWWLREVDDEMRGVVC